MTRTAALERIGQMLEIPPSDLREDLTPSEVSTWDSFGHINIVAFLDNEFGVQLTVSEMASVVSLKSILDIIESRGAFTTSD